ncbi:MAG: pentapeptide repeat-containing protein [Synechococcales bacterium]|nr:pentapeptide repeat-containing protein [Synechococcales bacterium]
MKNRLLLIVGLGLLLLGAIAPSPAWATPPPPGNLLTLNLLQERLQAPVQRQGSRFVDLSHLHLDLRPENSDFRQQFYQLLGDRLQQSDTVLGLDLSESVIDGDLDLSALGLKVSLYSPVPPIFSEVEREQLERDRRRLSQLSQLSRSLLSQPAPSPLQISVLRGALRLGQTRIQGGVNLANTFFLGQVNGQGAQFSNRVTATDARFGQPVNLAGAVFDQDATWQNAIFFEKATFSQAQFSGEVSLQGSQFQAVANFGQTLFQETANLTRTLWQADADFAQARWQGPALFSKAQFSDSLYLSSATFADRLTFREAQFSQPVNLRGASILAQADFGDTTFAPQAYLNVSGLEFNADEAKILGNPGQIGQAISVPTLRGNKTLLRNLIRNFRLQEQIPDANAIEYTVERLRLRQLRQNLLSINLNTASLATLQSVGFSAEQAQAVVAARQEQAFQRSPDVLKLDEIDLNTYVSVRDRIVALPPRTVTRWLLDGLHWMGLNLLLLLTRYGTSIWLIFGTGILMAAYFSLLFWLIDRLRRLRPTPLLPALGETLWMLGSTGIMGLGGFYAVIQTAQRPVWTLVCVGAIAIPIPALLTLLLYSQQRSHPLLNTSYFVEDGSARQLRLFIGRLPIMPRFAFFRDRYLPILWDRRWNWLNYLDFSLINLVKFGFNDIRLRDQHLPGLISALVWYQWGLGLLYIALLLWTLSRTIPGLNLLLYFG